MAFLSNAITTTYLTDQWGRRKYIPHTSNTPKSYANAFLRMILTGLAGIVIVEIYAAVMQREFQNTNNQVGKGFAILGIYLFVVIYCKFSFSDYLP